MGIALVGEPRVMFLDEPTSGLDSYTGGEVMQVVKVHNLRPLRSPLSPAIEAALKLLTALVPHPHKLIRRGVTKPHDITSSQRLSSADCCL